MLPDTGGENDDGDGDDDDVVDGDDDDDDDDDGEVLNRSRSTCTDDFLERPMLSTPLSWDIGLKGRCVLDGYFSPN